MASGKISDKNTTMSFVIPKDLKEDISRIASSENRSTSNLIVNLIDNYVELNKQKDRLTTYYKLISQLKEKDDNEWSYRLLHIFSLKQLFCFLSLIKFCNIEYVLFSTKIIINYPYETTSNLSVYFLWLRMVVVVYAFYSTYLKKQRDVNNFAQVRLRNFTS